MGMSALSPEPCQVRQTWGSSVFPEPLQKMSPIHAMDWGHGRSML